MVFVRTFKLLWRAENELYTLVLASVDFNPREWTQGCYIFFRKSTVFHYLVSQVKNASILTSVKLIPVSKIQCVRILTADIHASFGF